MHRLSLSFLIGLVAAGAGAQDHAKIQKDFPADEFVERRARVMEAIGDDAIAIVQGAPAPTRLHRVPAVQRVLLPDRYRSPPLLPVDRRQEPPVPAVPAPP